jgi:hypothetical protein
MEQFDLVFGAVVIAGIVLVPPAFVLFLVSTIAVRLKQDRLFTAFRNHDANATLTPRSRLRSQLLGHKDALPGREFFDQLNHYRSSTDPAHQQVRREVELYFKWQRRAFQGWVVGMTWIVIVLILFVIRVVLEGRAA